MDIEANLRQQREKAEEVMAIWDKCPASGKFTEWQERDLIRLAYELAELVQAALEYRSKCFSSVLK